MTPGRPPFVAAVRPKTLLQVVIGPGESRDLIAMKAPRPVTPRDLQEVLQGRHECPSGLPVPHHGSAPAAQATRDGHGGRWLLVAAEVGGAMPPAIGDAHRWPQGSRLDQSALEPGVQPGQGPGEGPLVARRARRWARAVGRPCSVRPEATRGGWPSAGSALRTALQ